MAAYEAGKPRAKALKIQFIEKKLKAQDRFSIKTDKKTQIARLL